MRWTRSAAFLLRFSLPTGEEICQVMRDLE